MSPQSLHARIFREALEFGTPFRSEHWPLLLFGEHLPRSVSPYFVALAEVAQLYGDSELYLGDENDPDVVTRTSWEPQAFQRARFELPFGAVMFGDSGSWGGVLTDEDFTCIGGEPEFMGLLAEKLGGKDVVRSDFDKWIASAEGLDISAEKAMLLSRLNRRDV